MPFNNRIWSINYISVIASQMSSLWKSCCKSYYIYFNIHKQKCSLRAVKKQLENFPSDFDKRLHRRRKRFRTGQKWLQMCFSSSHLGIPFLFYISGKVMTAPQHPSEYNPTEDLLKKKKVWQRFPSGKSELKWQFQLHSDQTDYFLLRLQHKSSPIRI